MTVGDFFEHYQPVAIPHEVLGVSAHERDRSRIVDAMERRLRAVCDQPCEAELRDVLCRLIRRSCERMLDGAAALTSGLRVPA